MTYTPIPQGTLNWDVPVNAAFADQDTRITNNTAAIVSNTSAIGANGTAIAALQNTGFTPADHNMITWSIDPTSSMLGTNITTGVLTFTKVKIPTSVTVNNILYSLTANAVTPVAGQNFVALYDAAGNRLVVSGDQSTNYTSGAGIKTAPVTPTLVSAGAYYIGFLSNAATAPQVSASPNVASTALPNVNLTAGIARSIISGAGNTSFPATVTFSSFTMNSVVRWGGLS